MKNATPSSGRTPPEMKATGNVTIATTTPRDNQYVIPDPSNDLPFSGECQGRVRAYHGREEPRASARGVAAEADLRPETRGVRLLQLLVSQTSGTLALVKFLIEIEQEEDGRWIAEVPDLPGVLAYGTSRADAIGRAQALALRVLADRIEHGEAESALLDVSFKAA
jgi:predicted RNase H-like HicB family nuclease